MNKHLRSRALWNSSLLTFNFTMSTIATFVEGHYIIGLIGLAASLITVNDVVTFYNAQPNQTEQENN